MLPVKHFRQPGSWLNTKCLLVLFLCLLVVYSVHAGKSRLDQTTSTVPLPMETEIAFKRKHPHHSLTSTARSADTRRPHVRRPPVIEKKSVLDYIKSHFSSASHPLEEDAMDINMDSSDVEMSLDGQSLPDEVNDHGDHIREDSVPSILRLGKEREMVDPKDVFSDFGVVDKTDYHAEPFVLPPAKSDVITLLHTNDIHSHFDQFNEYGTECKQSDIEKNQCFGGIARISYLVNLFRRHNPNVLLMDAGDQFQGTLFYSVFKGEKIAEWMNDIQYDVMALGNHEFDDGQEYLGEFIKNLTFPMISSNLNLDDAPFLKEAGLKPYVVFPHLRLGVIGFITNTTSEISIAAKDIHFYHPVGIVQRYVDQLHAMGIRRIICVSHNGYADDKYLAENTRGIHLIVGGHSHSFLNKDLYHPIARVEGTYPTPVINLDGRLTYVVQAHRFGDFLGHVDLEFNQHDELVRLGGDPILLDQRIPMDPHVAMEVAAMREIFQEKTKEIVTVLNNTLDFISCRNQECRLANLVFGSMLEYAYSLDSGFHFAFCNTGGLRAGLQKGPVSVADVIDLLPFGHTLVSFTMNGTEVQELIERTINMKWKDGRKLASIPQFAGLRYVYSTALFRQNRVHSISILDPSTGDYEQVVPDKLYKVMTNDFVANGGDNIMHTNLRHAKNTGVKMDEALLLYMKKWPLLDVPLDGRMQRLTSKWNFFKRRHVSV